MTFNKIFMTKGNFIFFLVNIFIIFYYWTTIQVFEMLINSSLNFKLRLFYFS